MARRSDTRVPPWCGASLAAVLGVLLLSGCVDALGEEAPSVGELERDCPVTLRDGTRLDTQPVSVPFDAATVWVFPSLETASKMIVNAAAEVTDRAAACRGEVDPVESEGAIVSVLGKTEMESTEREDHGIVTLVPSAGFVIDGVGYFFFEKRLRAADGAESRLGTGLCRLPNGAGACERVTHAGAAQGEDVLFAPEALAAASAAVDGAWLFVLSCSAPAAFETVCKALRAPRNSVEEPGAYEYRSFEGWSSNPSAAVAVSHDAGASSWFRGSNGEVVLVTTDLVSGAVSLRVASDFGEGFGDRRPLFGALAPAAGTLLGGARVELGFGGAAVDRIDLGYTTTHESAPGLHLASFVLDDPPR